MKNINKTSIARQTTQSKWTILTVVLLVMAMFVSSSGLATTANQIDVNAFAGIFGSRAVLTMDDTEDIIIGLDSTWMWSNDNTSWVTGSATDKFKKQQTVRVAPKNEWADVKAWSAADAPYEGGQKVAHNGTLWQAKYYAGASDEPGKADNWEAINSNQPTAQYTFNFTQATTSEILQALDKERARLLGMRKVFGYMPSWGAYGGHEFFDVLNDFRPEDYTHITYSFLQPVNIDTPNPTIQWDDEWAALGNYPTASNDSNLVGLVPKLQERLAQYKDKRLVFSVGGWTYSERKEFERATSTPQKTAAFAQNIVDFMYKWGFDGIDIDWEFPLSFSEEAKNDLWDGTSQYPQGFKPADQFIDLHRELRERMTTLSLETEEYYELSTATTPGISRIQYIKPAELVKYVDTVNYMAYDYNGAWQPITGHNAPLYETSVGSTEPEFWIDVVTQEYLKQGVPTEQLMFGVSFYSRSWVQVPNQEKVSGLPGLGIAGVAPDELAEVEGGITGGLWGNGSNPYYRMEELIAGTAKAPGGFPGGAWAKDYKSYWDEGAQVPYLYSPTDKIFHTYDDERSLNIKVDYLRKNNLAGAIVWDITGDTRPNKGTSQRDFLANIIGDIVDEPVNSDNARITTTSLPNVEQGNSYSATINATGNGVNITVVSKPSWLTTSGSGATFNLSATAQQTPNAKNGDTIKVKATASNGSTVEKEFAFVVKEKPSAPQITTKTLANAEVEQNYSEKNQKIEATGSNLTYSLQNAPSWLTINAQTGALSGTPKEGDIGSKTLSITVKDDWSTPQTATAQLSIEVVVGAPKITTTSLGQGTINVPYQGTIQASGIQKTFSITNQTANVLSIDPTSGKLSGTFTTTYPKYSITVKVENSGGADSKTFEFAVTETLAPPEFDTQTLPNAKVGELYSVDIVVHSQSTLTYTITNQTLTNTLSINASGKLSGTFTQAYTSYSLTVQATDAQGQSQSKTYSIVVISDDNGNNGNNDDKIDLVYDGDIVVGQYIKIQVNIKNINWTSVEITNLPKGLSFIVNKTTDTVLMQGYPTESGNFAVTITVYINGSVLVARDIAPRDANKGTVAASETKNLMIQSNNNIPTPTANSTGVTVSIILIVVNVLLIGGAVYFIFFHNKKGQKNSRSNGNYR